MSPACYTCKHCKRKDHLAKDCPELGEQEQDQHQQQLQQQHQGDKGGTFERESSSADRLLVEEEEEGARGFNDIRMIFDDEEEEGNGNGNGRESYDEVTGEHNNPRPRSESTADVQRYK